MKRYSVEWFIRKFSRIPAKDIGHGSIAAHCALWHCGVDGHNYMTTQARALGALLEARHNPRFVVNPEFTSRSSVYEVNDNEIFGKTPKTRILNVLRRVRDVRRAFAKKNK